MTTTAHDIEVNGVNYILEWTQAENGEAGHIAITQATNCDEEHADDETCDGCELLDIHDFTEEA